MTFNRFEDLRIWQQARAQANAVYDSLGGDSPADKDFGFRGKMQRCAASAMINIAEGFGRRSDRDFVCFPNIAKGSNGEVRSMLYLAEDRHYLTTAIAEEMRSFAESLGEGIEALDRHLRID